ncbi:predicted protein [Plenodomus lingam JN3]|uniref:Predicted protein n=1 Tax=Leptosphaeria maculans (strain JN3 / isolate v23.1.3 / race Av1-4-5-6-7-8) TaxID=985895 RepID=E4ZJ58_LEPMJ|nr:predicted protein [Plenodomus lingam JN3]CBX91489.1 predicted protein [Plenodomus lingam JN3]
MAMPRQKHAIKMTAGPQGFRFATRVIQTAADLQGDDAPTLCAHAGCGANSAREDAWGVGCCKPSTQPSNQSPGRFIFQIETPSQTAKTTEPSSELWKAATKEFIRAVPKNEKDWSDRRKQVGLHQPEAVIHTFCLLTRHSQQLSSLNIGDAPGTEASILNILSDYQVFTSVLGAEKAYATQVSNYSTLLFVGLSIVAFSVGTDPEKVENHMRKFLTHQQSKVCTAKGSYLSKLRTAALGPIKRMDELCEKGLKDRSWEIFVLCMASSNVLAIHC